MSCSSSRDDAIPGGEQEFTRNTSDHLIAISRLRRLCRTPDLLPKRRREQCASANQTFQQCQRGRQMNWQSIKSHCKSSWPRFKGREPTPWPASLPWHAPPKLVVNCTVHAISESMGSMRIAPGQKVLNGQSDLPPVFSEEATEIRESKDCPLPAGAAIFRDLRTWHGGTPNLG